MLRVQFSVPSCGAVAVWVVTCLLAWGPAASAAPTAMCRMPSGALAVAAVPDNVLCRSAYFWESRAGLEHGGLNITQSVIDAAGGLQVCGQEITRTSNPEEPYVQGLGLSSALEGLCVRVQDVRQRQLYRQLVATALNCELSTAASAEACDEIVQQFVNVDFSACNGLCAGETEDGPTVSKCIRHLRCFNVGGTIVEGGRCALGTCASQSQLFCGMDYDACPLINEKHQSCRRFRGNCHKKALCQQGIGVCPATERRSSTEACREASRNACTIDACASPGIGK